MEVFDDLEAEQDRLEEILATFDGPAWASPSGASGWTIADVVLHLAQTEEAVVASVEGRDPGPGWRVPGTVDEIVAGLVAAERAAGSVVFERWRTARRAAVAGLRAADPQRPLAWVAAPLKPRTLATTRLAEHWAHGLDVTEALGIPFPDTDRLRHIAWLAHGSLPYAFALAGMAATPVACTLATADGTTLRYGPDDADSTIAGPLGDFCRVAAQRLAPADSALTTSGPHGAAALAVLRTYAA
jgi:uncharacterized protein (TIGR03084 family)